ncbi:MAG: phosphatase PAP2 family protein [Phormidesmis sp.]
MKALLARLAAAWKKQVHTRIASFVAFFGVVWLGLCILIVYLLAELSDEVLEKEAFALDRTILLYIHQFASPTLDAIVVGITRIGDPKTVVPLTAIVLCFLWLKRYRTEAKIFALDAFGGVVLSYFLKLAFNKQRPQLWDSPIVETTFSYPSGHALGSMVLYGFLSYVFATIYPRYAKVFYSVATVLIIFIGLSRLYLGVHWPTDIAAGYGIGFLWISVCIALLRLQKDDEQKVG